MILIFLLLDKIQFLVNVTQKPQRFSFSQRPSVDVAIFVR